jgi:hypothetical protein
MDRPDTFVEIPDPEDPVDRMLQVVKFWIAKDAKWMVCAMHSVVCSHLTELEQSNRKTL